MWIAGACASQTPSQPQFPKLPLCQKKQNLRVFDFLISPRRVNTAKTDWEMNSVYVFRLKRGTAAISTFHLVLAIQFG